MDELAGLDATAHANLIRRKEITPQEAVDAAITRIEKLNPAINAVIHPLFDDARASARAVPNGPFRGVPIVLKDLVSPSASHPFHRGMKLLRDLDWRATHDSFVVQRLKAAGFVIVGRTNTPELGLMPTTEPDAYGPTRNPWDETRIPGGSSGGSAAAVASRMVPIAHGTDGGGSIRIPSSACGLVGLKPSRARVSSGPDFGESGGGFSVEHVLARSVRDSAAVLDVLAGPMLGDPYAAPPPAHPFVEDARADPERLRIGMMLRAPYQLVELDPDVVAATREAATALETAGHVVEEHHPSALDESEHIIYYGTLTACDTAFALDGLSALINRPITQTDVEPGTWAIAELGRASSGPQLASSREWLFAFSRRIASWWEGGFDLLLTPTLTAPPPPLGSWGSTPDNPLAGSAASWTLVPFTPPFNVTGQPAISLPVHWNAEGLPIGVQLVAAYGREDVLLRVAGQLERAMAWGERRPPISA